MKKCYQCPSKQLTFVGDYSGSKVYECANGHRTGTATPAMIAWSAANGGKSSKVSKRAKQQAAEPVSESGVIAFKAVA